MGECTVTRKVPSGLLIKRLKDQVPYSSVSDIRLTMSPPPAHRASSQVQRVERDGILISPCLSA